MPASLFATVWLHFIINLLLQTLDGFLSYRILSAGVPEANPLVSSAITQWGTLWGLIYWKALACVLLSLMFALRHRRRTLVIKAFTLTAAVYAYSNAGLALLFLQMIR
jgi:hypothetical protein